MKYILVLVISFVGLSSLSSQNVIDRHFDYLAEAEDATNVSITGKMFEMINSINVEVESDDAEDLQEMQDFLGSIRSFQLVAAKPDGARKKFDVGNNKLINDYEELITVKDKEGSFMLYVDEQNGTVHEVVGIGTDNEQLMVFSLLGAMKLEHVGKVAEHIQNAGIDQLSKVKDFQVDEVKVYPNPAISGSAFSLETPEAFDGGIATLYDNNGSLVKTYKINNTSERHTIENIPVGNYILKVEKDAVSIKKKMLIVQ